MHTKSHPHLLLIVLLIALLVAPTTAAADMYSDMNIIIDDDIVDSYNYHVDSSVTTGAKEPKYFRVKQSENYMGRVVLIWFSNNIINNNDAIHSNQTSVAIMKGETIIGNGILGYYRDSTKAGYIFLDFVWEVPQSGSNTYYIRSSSDLESFAVYSLDNLKMFAGSTPIGEMSDTLPAGFQVTLPPDSRVVAGDYTLNVFKPFRHNIEVTEHTEFADRINVYRVVDGTPYNSIVSISGKSGEYVNSTGQTNIEYQIGNEDRPYRVTIYNMFDKWYEYHFYEEMPTSTDPDESATLTVYIKNSQTGALIANANVAIDALVDGEYYPVVNRTEPSGIFTITLQPTGGGKPNPDEIGRAHV